MEAVTATASFRFGKSFARWFERSGARVIVGKAGLTEAAYREWFVPHGAVYLTTVGYGLGATYGRAIRRVVEVHWLEELGLAQALWVLEVERLGPFLVEGDRDGQSLFALANREINLRLQEVYRDLPGYALSRFGEASVLDEVVYRRTALLAGDGSIARPSAAPRDVQHEAGRGGGPGAPTTRPATASRRTRSPREANRARHPSNVRKASGAGMAPPWRRRVEAPVQEIEPEALEPVAERRTPPRSAGGASPGAPRRGRPRDRRSDGGRAGSTWCRRRRRRRAGGPVVHDVGARAPAGTAPRRTSTTQPPRRRDERRRHVALARAQSRTRAPTTNGATAAASPRAYLRRNACTSRRAYVFPSREARRRRASRVSFTVQSARLAGDLSSRTACASRRASASSALPGQRPGQTHAGRREAGHLGQGGAKALLGAIEVAAQEGGNLVVDVAGHHVRPREIRVQGRGRWRGARARWRAGTASAPRRWSDPSGPCWWRTRSARRHPAVPARWRAARPGARGRTPRASRRGCWRGRRPTGTRCARARSSGRGSGSLATARSRAARRRSSCAGSAWYCVAAASSCGEHAGDVAAAGDLGEEGA